MPKSAKKPITHDTKNPAYGKRLPKCRGCKHEYLSDQLRFGYCHDCYVSAMRWHHGVDFIFVLERHAKYAKKG